MSALPKFSIKELLEAGVHFGHKTMRWNPKMAPYIFGTRNNVHIIDLQQTAPLLHQALRITKDIVSKNGRILFVGTKRQASETIANQATRCGQYYVNHRWLGGMATNWNTVSNSIKTLSQLEEKLANTEIKLTKKERLMLDRKREKLDRSLGGIREMGGKPDLLFVVDTNKEKIAIDEAKKLGIPVIAVVDSNSDPDKIDYPIPGNDDATRAIELYARLIADAALSGIEDALTKSGADIGESATPTAEAIPAKPTKAAPVEKEVALTPAETEAPAQTEQTPAAKEETPVPDVKVEVKVKKTAAKNKKTEKSDSAETEKIKEEKKPAAKKKTTPQKATKEKKSIEENTETKEVEASETKKEKNDKEDGAAA